MLAGGAAAAGIYEGSTVAVLTSTGEIAVAPVVAAPEAITATTASSSGAGSAALANINAAVPYAMIAVAAYDIFTAKNVHWTEQIRNAAVAGVNALKSVNTETIERIQNLQSAGLGTEAVSELSGIPGKSQGIVGTSAEDKQFVDFAAAQGATVLSSDEGSLIRTDKYCGDREVESIEQLVAEFKHRPGSSRFSMVFS